MNEQESTANTDQKKPKKQGKRFGGNSEISAMHHIAKVLDRLPKSKRIRVAAWAVGYASDSQETAALPGLAVTTSPVDMTPTLFDNTHV